MSTEMVPVYVYAQSLKPEMGRWIAQSTRTSTKSAEAIVLVRGHWYLYRPSRYYWVYYSTGSATVES